MRTRDKIINLLVLLFIAEAWIFLELYMNGVPLHYGFGFWAQFTPVGIVLGVAALGEIIVAIKKWEKLDVSSEDASDHNESYDDSSD